MAGYGGEYRGARRYARDYDGRGGRRRPFERGMEIGPGWGGGSDIGWRTHWRGETPREPEPPFLRHGYDYGYYGDVGRPFRHGWRELRRLFRGYDRGY